MIVDGFVFAKEMWLMKITECVWCADVHGVRLESCAGWEVSCAALHWRRHITVSWMLASVYAVIYITWRCLVQLSWIAVIIIVVHVGQFILKVID